jgi:hypothetical protein
MVTFFLSGKLGRDMKLPSHLHLISWSIMRWFPGMLYVFMLSSWERVIYNYIYPYNALCDDSEESSYCILKNE